MNSTESTESTIIQHYSFLSLFLSGAALTVWNAIPWTCVFLLLRWTGVRLYILKNQEVCRRIQSRIKYTSHMADDDKGYGYAIGFWYFMEVVDNYDHNYNIWMIATEASYKALSADVRDIQMLSDTASTESAKPQKPLGTYYRSGTFANCYYSYRAIYNDWTPRPEQVTALATIRADYALRNNSVVYLHGPPGSGKSMLALLVAKALNGNYCNTFKPWEPGDTLSNLYSSVEPSAEKPLIITFDEFDIPLSAIHSGSIESHKHIPIFVKNKTDWNTFLDEIKRGLYPYVVLVLTSNQPPAFFDELDPSLLREGRVDLVLPLNKEKAE